MKVMIVSIVSIQVWLIYPTPRDFTFYNMLFDKNKVFYDISQQIYQEDNRLTLESVHSTTKRDQTF